MPPPAPPGPPAPSAAVVGMGAGRRGATLDVAAWISSRAAARDRARRFRFACVTALWRQILAQGGDHGGRRQARRVPSGSPGMVEEAAHLGLVGIERQGAAE